MTKQEFLDGKWFKLNSDSSFVYRCNNNGSSITEGVIMSNGDIVSQTFQGVIEKITPKQFKGYGYVMAKRVKFNFKFEDLILAEM
jgi:hypothetical protein